MRRFVFAARCAAVAAMASAWSRDTLVTYDGGLEVDERDETVRRFISEVQERLHWMEEGLRMEEAKRAALAQGGRDET